MNVAIVDYGSGNLHSAAKAFERAGREAGLAAQITVTSDPDRLSRADRIVLPGVGAFADCRRGLAEIDGMVEALNDCVRTRGRPFLGICVGMQLMAERGCEYEVTDGLGWIKEQYIFIVAFGSTPILLSRPRSGLRRHARDRRSGRGDDGRRAAAARGERSQARPRQRPRARRAAYDLSRDRALRPGRRGERGAPLPSGHAPARCARGSTAGGVRTRARTAGCAPLLGGPFDRRHGPSERGDRAGGDPRSRPRAARHLQQGRGDGAAVRGEQGERPQGGARGARTVGSQRGRDR